MSPIKALLTTLIFSATLLITACGDGQPTGETGERPASPASLRPADPDLAALYMQSCFSCHSRGTARAPRTGVAHEWEPRLAKGMETLLDNTIDGMSSGMPPMGMCGACDEEDFEALILFMAGKEQ